MNVVEKYPGINEALLECRDKVEAITGKKVTIDFSFKFHYLSTDMLATIICNVCGISWADIISEKKKAPVIIGRQLFCYFAFYTQRKTLAEIAKITQRSDHSVIIRARDKVVDMITTKDELYMPLIEEVENQINETLK